MASQADAALAPKSPYARAHEELSRLGYHCIPLLPAKQIPGIRKNGEWRFAPEWQVFRDRAPTEFDKNAHASWPDANIGLVLGTRVGEYQVGAVDLDALDLDELEQLKGAIPQSPMVKVGSKGETRFYKMPLTMKSRGYRAAKPSGRGLADLLTGQQTCMPPSLHPLGPTYKYLAGPVAAHDLPVFTADDLARLEDTLEHLGWNGKDVEEERAARRQSDRPDGDLSIWQEVNAAAMARLDAWIPDLQLYKCRAVRRGGFECVPDWRPSSTGQRLEDRKLSMKMHPDGLRDVGADKGYSPLDLVAAARNVELDIAFQWLKDRAMDASEPVFAMPDAAPTTMPAQPIAPLPDAPARPIAPQSEEVPAHLLKVSGLVGEIMGALLDTALKPQPILALGAALTLVGTASGLRYAGPTMSATHLFVLGLAPTGSGKNHPLNACNTILGLAKMPRERGPSQFMSYSSVIKRMERHPLMLCAMDEFGSFLAKINNRKSSGSHEQAISGILRTAWGNSFTTMTTPEYANEPSKSLHCTAISIFGASTHKEFYRALSADDKSNGFLNRFLILSTKRKPAEVEPKYHVSQFPERLTVALKAIYDHDPKGALSRMTGNVESPTPPSVVVPWGPGAKEIYKALSARMTDIEEDDEFFVRTAEMAVRLATIVAIGVDHLAPVLTADLMQWAGDLCEWSSQRMAYEAVEHMAESEFQSNCNDVMQLILNAKDRSMTRRVLGQRYRKVNGVKLDEIVKTLLDQERITEERVPASGNGNKPAHLYRPA